MGEHLKRRVESLEEEGKANPNQDGSGLASDFERLGKATKDIASDSLNAVKDELGGLYKQGKKMMMQGNGQLKDRIRSHPVQTLLIAAGVGFMIGWLNRKSKKCA